MYCERQKKRDRDRYKERDQPEIIDNGLLSLRLAHAVTEPPVTDKYTQREREKKRKRKNTKKEIQRKRKKEGE